MAAGLLAAVYTAVVFRQLSGRGPENWQSFAVGGAATVLLEVLDLGGAEGAIAEAIPVLVFLFALFVFAIALERAGALDHLALWLVSRARTPRDLPLVVFLGFGLLSGFLVNDALVLLGVPLLLSLSKRRQIPARPLLLSLAYSVTVGSVLTPLGNPQNLLVSLSSGLDAPVTTFLRYLLVPTLLNLGLGALYLRHAFRRDLAGVPSEAVASRPLFPPGDWWGRFRRAPVLLLFPATMGTIVGSDVAADVLGRPSWPIYEIALGGALVLLLLTPQRRRVLAGVDWSILVLFAGLFLVVAGAIQGGIIQSLEAYLPIPPAGSGLGALLPLTAGSLAGPQLVSNVPWVALQIPVLHQLGYGPSTPLAWVALAAASTLAGNVTLLGAASNLIVVEEAERGGVAVRLPEFVRHGLPLTGLTVGVLVGCLALGL